MTSTRIVGTTIFIESLSAFSIFIPSLTKISLISSEVISTPNNLFTFFIDIFTVHGFIGFGYTSAIALTLAPANSSNISIALITAVSATFGSKSLSNLYAASVCRLYLRCVKRIEDASKDADSKMILCVSSVTALPIPPITPAKAIGFSPSVMTISFSSNFNSVSSNKVNFSSFLACRTEIFFITSAEKACNGCPVSSIT